MRVFCVRVEDTLAKKETNDREELFSIDAPDVEGADGSWDDWDDADIDVDVSAVDDAVVDEVDVVDVPEQEQQLEEDEAEAENAADVPTVEPATYEVADAADEDWGDDDWDDEVEAVEDAESDEAVAEETDLDVGVAESAVAIEEAVQPEESEAHIVEEHVATESDIAEEAEDEASIDAVEEEDDEPAGELQVSAEELAEYLPPEPAPIQEEASVEESAPTPEEQEAAVDEALAQPVEEKSAEEIQREQEELEAYRSAMGETNAEMADVSEYKNFRKKTKTESKSNVPKKSDFDLFANRYKVKTMNAMVAAADPIVYFYNACLRADGSILSFNVYQVLQDRFIGKMVPQLFTAVAENSSKIEDLNEANLIEQIKVCAEYPQYDFIISISARFFTKPALLDRFLRLLPEGGVPNMVLAFDCTSLESIAIAAKAGLGAVRQKGVKILLDNTEKVTMTVLSEFDYDYIRIDSRYYEMGNPRAEAYLRLLLSLTKEQNVSTIASFCDTEDLSEYMFFMGVDAVQGNAVSRPMRTVPNAVRGITLLPSMLDA